MIETRVGLPVVPQVPRVHRPTWHRVTGLGVALLLVVLVASAVHHSPPAERMGTVQGKALYYGGPAYLGHAQSGVPLRDIQVRLVSTTGAVVATTRTDRLGTFSFREPHGTYRASVDCGAGTWSQAEGVSVTSGLTTTLPDLLCLGL